jgi:hypothetical protein
MTLGNISDISLFYNFFAAPGSTFAQKRNFMKAVVIGEGSGASMETIMAVYPRHKAVVDKYIEKGEVIGIGPFVDSIRGNMAIFRTREAAEQFVKEDPFILEGLVKSFVIRDWKDDML